MEVHRHAAEVDAGLLQVSRGTRMRFLASLGEASPMGGMGPPFALVTCLPQ